MTKKLTLVIALASSLIMPLHVSAQDSADGLSRCLADNTTGRDRKELARWIFFSMAAHPEFKQYATSETAKFASESAKQMASMLTRLLTESCTAQARATSKLGGALAVQSAFQTLGQLAMQELMSDDQVKASMAAFQKHINLSKFNEVFGGQ